MGLFKKKKIYCVSWKWYNTSVEALNQSIVKAYDVAGAWKVLKREHPTADYCHSIIEIKPEGFQGVNRII
jgi:hypothetical protein